MGLTVASQGICQQDTDHLSPCPRMLPSQVKAYSEPLFVWVSKWDTSTKPCEKRIQSLDRDVLGLQLRSLDTGHLLAYCLPTMLRMK